MSMQELTKEQLEQKASKILDQIASQDDQKESLKQAVINLLIFGHADFIYKERGV